MGFVRLLLPPTAATTKGRSPARPGEAKQGGFRGEKGTRDQSPRAEVQVLSSTSGQAGGEYSRAFSPTSPGVDPSTGHTKWKGTPALYPMGPKGVQTSLLALRTFQSLRSYLLPSAPSHSPPPPASPSPVSDALSWFS